MFCNKIENQLHFDRMKRQFEFFDYVESFSGGVELQDKEILM